MTVQKRLSSSNYKELTTQDRISFHNIKFPNWSKLHVHNNIMYGFWMTGRWYKHADNFYGSYPPNYLNRIRSLFPDCRKILHLFSGVLEKEYEEEVTFDINPEHKPDVCGDVINLVNYFHKGSFELILADPPYEDKDFEKYGYEPFSKRKVIEDSRSILNNSGFLVWLNTRMPMYSNKLWDLIGTIGLIQSTNHRVRMVTIFQKV